MRSSLLLLLLACSPEPDPDAPGGPNGSQELDPRRDPSTWPTTLDADRPAAVYAPETYDGTSDLPLVLVLHGYGANGAVQDSYFGLSARAHERGMVVLVPDGTIDASNRRFWNATDACCDFGGTRVDDAGYLIGLVDQAIARFPIDPARVTAVGHSNGGFMAYRLACQAPDRLAGVVSLAGAMYADLSRCPGTEPVSALQIHGTLDTTILYAGGALATGSAYPSAETSASVWAERAGCGPRVDDGRGAYDNAVAGQETSRQRWSSCEQPVEVALWSMEGSSHIPFVNDTFREATLDWMLARRRAD